VSDSWALAIDFGTSRTAGAMASDATVTALEVEGNRWMASMVLLDPDGRLLVGTAADNQAGVYPDRIERTPKRLVGSSAPLVLGGEPVDVGDAIAALLRVFVDEGRLRRNGRDPSICVLTHPVRWEDARREFLEEVAQRAGLPDPRLVEEPVAAAIHYVSDQVGVGEYVGVYDLGGGTFDTAVLRRTDDGFETVGAPGGDEFIGGEHFDHHLFRFFGECLAADDAELWEQMATSGERKWKRAGADLLVQARRAKEALSSYPQTQVFVPVADRDIVVTRAQFEDMIREEVERTVDEMDDTIASAGLQPDELTAIYLVGGSSRIPLVVQLMTERFGSRIATRDEPKSVVALGAAKVAGTALSEMPESKADVDLATLPPPGASGASEPSTPRVPDASTSPAATSPAPAAATPSPAPPAATPSTPSSPWTAPPARSPTQWSLPNFRLPAKPQAPAPSGTAQPYPRVAPAGGANLSSLPPPRAQDRLEVPAPAPAPAEPDLPAPDVAWRSASTHLAGGAAVFGDTVVFASTSGDLHAVAGDDGATRWSASLGGPASGRPAVSDDVVYVGRDDGYVAAIDLATGASLWWAAVGMRLGGWMAAATGYAVVADERGTVHALDADAGRVRWALRFDAVVRALAALDGVVVAGIVDGRIVAMEPANGRVRWIYPTRGAIGGAFAQAGGTLYAPSADGMLYALDLATGQAQWAYHAGTPIVSGVASHGDTLYVASRPNGLHAVDAASGGERWRAEIAAESYDLAAAAAVVAATDGRGMLRAYDVADATPLWRAPGLFPAVTGDLVLANGTEGELVAYRPPA
jgi:outer membrane protein assembly factor BamB/Ethanolamine utilization protein EutJ (predicted chaperonin)